MADNDNIRDLARGMKHLYDESLDDLCEISPLYSEIREIDTQYTERSEIASGGMKTIFKVLDRKTDRYLAMAELHEDASEDFYENFIREARLTANLDHPNIISIHDIGIIDDCRPYFTMDLKVGDSLRQILKKLNEMDAEYEKRYPLNTRLEIFSKICDAIDYAHSRGVLHLDLKPDNIQIGTHGEVLVCDWGLAKVIDEPDSDTAKNLSKLDPDLLNDMTQSGEIKGTPGYMAPEQTVKDGSKTFQTDIYALGCLLYSILTYKTTVKGSLDEMMDATRKGLIHPPTKVCPEFFLHGTLDAIFSKATEIEPENRYQSVKELKNDISNFLAGYSTSVDKRSFVNELNLFYRRNKTACWTAICLSLILFIVTSLFIFNLNRRIKEAETANKIASHLSNKQISEHENFQKKLHKVSDKYLKQIKEQFRINFKANPVKTLNWTIDSLNDLISHGNVSQEVHDIKLECLFIRQDLNSFYALAGETHPLSKTARQFFSTETDSHLNSEELAELLLNLDDINLCEKVLIYHSAVSLKNDMYKPVLAYLKKLNPQCSLEKISLDRQTKTLKINCPDFKYIINSSKESLKCNPLSILKIAKIDFSGSGIKKFQMKGIQMVFDSTP